MGRESPPLYPLSDAGRGSSRQDLLYTSPGMFLPPPSTVSHLTSDVHVWSPLSMHHPSFRSSHPAGAHPPPGQWSNALLSAYMLHLLPHHHHHGHVPRPSTDSPRHSPPQKPLPLAPDHQQCTHSLIAENGSSISTLTSPIISASPSRYQSLVDNNRHQLCHRLPTGEAATDGDSD
jgi:hypothetical protein